MISPEPERHEHIRRTFFKSLGSPTSSGTGSLENLPSELIAIIGLRLDVASALAFTQASRRIRAVLATIPQYRQLEEHAFEVIWAMLQTGVANHISIAALHTTLVTHQCVFCGSFGGFVFLPTAARCCSRCLAGDSRFRMIPLHSLRNTTYKTHTQLSKLIPIVHSLPWIYSYPRVEKKVRTYIAPAWLAAEALQGQMDEVMLDRLTRLYELPTWRFMASMRLPFLNQATGRPQLELMCKGCHVEYITGDKSSGPFERWNRVYLEEDFLNHFRECEEAQKLWRSGEGASLDVKLSRYLMEIA